MRNYRDENVLEWVVSLYESAENTNRIEKHFIDYEITFGNQKRYIEDALRLKYPESWDSMTTIILAIARKIIRKLSRCYAAGANREVIDKETGAKNEELTKLFNYIYNDVDDGNRNFNMIMGKMNEYYSNHRYAELFMYVEDGTNRIRSKPLPQHLFMAVPNTTKTMAEAIVFKQKKSDFVDVKAHIDWEHLPEDLREAEVEGIYTLWTAVDNFTFVRLKKEEVDDEGHFTGEVVYRIAITSNDGNPEGKNPWGWNFVQIKDATDGHFYPDGSEIPYMGKELNVIFSDLVSIAAQQGFGQAVIYYDGDAPPAITKTGPTHIVNVPNKTGNSKFEFANPNPDLQGHLNIALSLVRVLLTTNDLTTDKVSGELSATNFASAIDRLIADSETIENIEDQRKRYVAAETKAFKVIMSMLRYLDSTKTMPEDYPKVNRALLDETKYGLKIIFNTIKPLTTEKDKATTIVYLEENGFIFPHEKHMRFNEGMTETEAKKREAELEVVKKARQKEAMFNQLDQLKENIANDRGNKQDNQFGKASTVGQKENRKPFVPQQRGQNSFGKRDSGPDKRKNEGRERRNSDRSRV